MINQYEEWLIEELKCNYDFNYQNIKLLNEYPCEIARDVLRILIENACLGQNYSPIELARRKIAEVNSEWLKENLLEVAKSCIDFQDEWEYRRLVELIIEVIPELKKEILKIGEKSKNDEVQEVVKDFRD